MDDRERDLRPLLVTLLSYSLPVALAMAVGAFFGISLYSWKFLALGIVLISFGTIIVYLEFKKVYASRVEEDFRVVLQENVPSIGIDPKELEIALEIIKKNDEKESELREEILFRNDEIQKLVQERDLERRDKERVQEESFFERQQLEERIESEGLKLLGMTETISNLKILLDRKQEEIDKLGGKIRDLTYEIKTLVQIADMGAPTDEKESFHKDEDLFRVPTPTLKKAHEPIYEQVDDAKTQLRRCLDIAQKITGSYHIGGYQSRFRDMAYDNYALDLRRLCDSLRSEKGAAVIVYSPKEDKLLFINNHVKTILGYSPEKFVQDFENIVQEGMGDLKKKISHLTTLSEVKTSLIIKNKTNEDIVLQCLLGLIPTGVFKNHILGVLYQ